MEIKFTLEPDILRMILSGVRYHFCVSPKEHLNFEMVIFFPVEMGKVIGRLFPNYNAVFDMFLSLATLKYAVVCARLHCILQLNNEVHMHESTIKNGLLHQAENSWYQSTIMIMLTAFQRHCISKGLTKNC